MRIHVEGYTIILCTFAALLILNLIILHLSSSWKYNWVFPAASLVFFCLVVSFFRNPNRCLTPDEQNVFAPADGQIVIIENVFEPEYFADERLQISIFMSPLNVHVNRYPVSGEISYYKYHPGDYIIAKYPKSSILNERTTVVIKMDNGQEVMVRQIAGAVARRIVCYAEEGQQVTQGTDMGFIKFGSRVDIFLPVGTPVDVEIGQKVKGNRTIISHL